MKPQVFQYITPERFKRLQATAAKAGLVIASDNGEAELRIGFAHLKFEFHYDRVGCVLVIECKSAPAWITEHKIAEELEALVTATV